MTRRARAPYHLFEVSWEVCNKVGGIYTVVSSKARTLTALLGDQYVVVGPWLLSDEDDASFEEEPGHDAFCEACRAMGVPVRVGRWKIEGRPLTLLVEFSGLYAEKDDILKVLWEDFEVDSLSGGWDYVEPVVFGVAAGRVISRWWQEYVAPRHGQAVAQFHEWMTGAGMLGLRVRAPQIATVFTTHATMLGRSIASTGVPPVLGLAGRTPRQVAEDRSVVAKHSLEGVCARTADVFTTVSAVTAAEAELYHERRPEPLLWNGIDLDVIDGLCAGHPREEVSATLRRIAHAVTGAPADGACLVVTSGRYEFRNKGIDLLLAALARLNADRGAGRREVVLFVLVPAAHSGLRGDVARRLSGADPLDGVALGLSTHELPAEDPVHVRCEELGLDNAPGSRVRVVEIPIYIEPGDGVFDMNYEAVLRGFDVSCFPSFYEPWGYTPQESIAVGVPTVTSDFAGFGAWAAGAGVADDDGVHVLPRDGRTYEESRDLLADWLSAFVGREPGDVSERCRRAAARTSWTDFVANYTRAFEEAIERAAARCADARIERFRPRIAVPVATKEESAGPRLFEFDVSATLPPELSALSRIAGNFWWSWVPEARSLFEELSPRSWKVCGNSPVRFLRSVFGEDVAARASDRDYIRRLADLEARFDAYMADRTRELPLPGGGAIDGRHPIAYFCAEFGIHESLPIYSGGLGILAGDHLKSASDLNLPLVGVGLFYRKGYMRQRLDLHGNQIAVEQENDPRNLPLELVQDEHGRPLEVTLSLPSSSLVLRTWRARVGRVDLYLLDADCDANRPEDRLITERLYSAEPEMRLKQLIVLGRGGVLLLRRLGIDPAACHINEGHGAFAALERVRRLRKEDGLSFEQARQVVRSTTLFTTHTPVPAGHDRFSEDLMRRYFSNLPNWAGIGWDEFVALGRAADADGDFNMTYLALGFADFVNGVSQLHGTVSRELLQPFWKGLLTSEVPVGSITNGVHLSTWVNPELAALVGATDRTVRGDDFELRSETVAVDTLWKTRQRARAHLLRHVQAVLEASFVERQDSPALLGRMAAGLDERALLIGFARRFVPYKRSNLAFRDLDRLARILGDQDRPVRLFFAGKAHPADGSGQELVKQVAELARRDEFVGKVFFLENYDIEIARSLVQGVDVWLNNPIRTLEASGTSGMKVAANGGLNLSVLDGWWVEGYDGKNGWSIGNQRMFPDQELQNELDAENLYRLLEDEVVPLFFDRDAKGRPLRWLERVRHDLATIPHRFDSDRMVAEYRDRGYLPLADDFFRVTANGHSLAIERAERAARIRKAFPSIEIASAVVTDLDGFNVGDQLRATVETRLAGLTPDDVRVELVLGHTRGEKPDLHDPVVVPLEPNGDEHEGVRTFVGTYRMERSGNYAYGLRVRGRESQAGDHTLSDLVRWA